jgi:hypothetical protein
MNHGQKLSAVALCVAASVGICNSALAGVTIKVEEVGSDVVMAGGGTLDLSLWTLFTPGFGTPGMKADEGVSLGPDPMHEVDLYFTPQGFAGPASIGTGTSFIPATSGSGDPSGLTWTAPMGLTELLGVPSGYTSGDPIIGSTALFEGESFLTMGISPGSYTWTWDTATGGSDFFTINVNVPAPGALALFGFAFLRPRRRRM